MESLNIYCSMANEQTLMWSKAPDQLLNGPGGFVDSKIKNEL